MPASSRPIPSDRSSDLPQIDPIILSARPDSFDHPDWLFEPKYDGFRGILYHSKGICQIRSRRDIQSDRFDDLCRRVAGGLGPRATILAGEVVALTRQG